MEPRDSESKLASAGWFLLSIVAMGISLGGLVYAFAKLQRVPYLGSILPIVCISGFVVSSYWFHRIRLGGPMATPHPLLWILRLAFGFFLAVMAAVLFFQGKGALHSGEYHYGYTYTPPDSRYGRWGTHAYRGEEARRIGAGLIVGSAVPALYSVVLLWPGILRLARRRRLLVRFTLVLWLTAIVIMLPPWRIASSWVTTVYYAVPVAAAVIVGFSIYMFSRRRNPGDLLQVILAVSAASSAVACIATSMYILVEIGPNVEFVALLYGGFAWLVVAGHLPFIRLSAPEWLGNMGDVFLASSAGGPADYSHRSLDQSRVSRED